MSLGAFALVASEFMPVSLLTPIAANLHISEGQAGQAISVSGAFAVLTSLFISSLTKGINRKTLLLSLIGMMIISGTVVSLAPTYIIFMLGRAMIGVVIGGFWSMSAATAMRLVEDHHVPRALAILNGGNALATVIAAPAGSFLGGLIGWRGAFFCVVPVAVIVFVWQLISLPSMPSERNRQSASVFALLTRPIVRVGMIAVSLFFMGQFTLFTYVRPFLEDVAHVDVRTLSLILLSMGISGFIGTVLIGSALKKSVYPVLISIPLLMAFLAFGLLVLGKWIIVSAVILTIWGLFATSAPVGWWSWLARTLPRDAEAGGGLMVAVVQFAITLGATGGGMFFDGIGYQATFAASAVVLLVAAWLAFVTMRLAHSR
ncbi:MFS transporter [Acetobacter indonesiensis]|uniref:MFS transporter n=1 Tax=Acetobacter indonesiensis TaxID=104101 RepID=UPI001F3E78E9|nr:MFS transporter [Acetobacter indonesiensis]